MSARWRHAFDEVAERVGTQFARPEARSNARAYLEGLLAPVERKNGWQLAEAAGDETPYAMQHLLGRAKWDADAARDDLRAYVVERLGAPEGVLALDETGFLKKGDKSAGVQRQYSGTAGRIENCQVGVFLAYVTPRGRTFLDRALYLPKGWADDRVRRERAGVPDDVAFATKPALGRQMLRRALDAGVPCAWVVADEVDGSDSDTRRLLEERGQPFVLAVTSGQRLRIDFVSVPVKDLVARVPPSGWRRLSAGDGTKGPRLYDWALWPFRGGGPRGWQHAVLFRRSVTDATDVAYYFTFAPPRTPLATLARVAGSRWGIEEGFESAKGEVGLDQYEVRSWPGWHRHITLALWAHAFLTVQRAEALGGEKIGTRRPRRRAAVGARAPASALLVASAATARPRRRAAMVVVASSPPSGGAPVPRQTASGEATLGTTVVLGKKCIGRAGAAAAGRPEPGSNVCPVSHVRPPRGARRARRRKSCAGSAPSACGRGPDVSLARRFMPTSGRTIYAPSRASAAFLLKRSTGLLLGDGPPVASARPLQRCPRVAASAPIDAASGTSGGPAMNKSDTTELAWAALDAQAIAKLLDRVTTDEGGLSARELCIARAHAWALVDGLQSLLASLPRVWVGETGLTLTPASRDDRTGGRENAS